MANEVNKIKELKYLRDKMYLYMDYLITNYGNAEIYAQTRKNVDKAFEEGNLKVLKSGENDIHEHIRGMPLKDAFILMNLFKEKLGEDISKFENKRLKSIEGVLARRRIKTVIEYELLMNRVDEIFSDVSKVEELKLINELLIGYEKQKKKP